MSEFAKFIALAVLLAMAASLLVFVPHARYEPVVITLVPRSSWERSIARHETHSYELSLQTGQVARVEVFQRDIDIHLTLMKADGSRLPDMDGSEWGTEALSVLANVTGVYRIGVVPNDHDSSRGTYVITVSEVRLAHPSDQTGEQGHYRFAQGVHELSEGTAESMSLAVHSFDAASALWHAAGDRRREAQALNRLGFVCQRVGKYDRAVDAFRAAIRIWKDLGDDGELANTWPQIGNASWHLDIVAEIPSKLELLRLWRKAGDRRGEATALSGIASEARLARDYARAADYEAQALSLRQALGNLGEVASSLQDLATLEVCREHFDKALTLGQRALSLNRHLGSDRGEAASLAQLGHIEWKAGKLQEAIRYLRQSLELRHRQGDRPAEAATYALMATVAWQQGNLTEALQYARRNTALDESLAASIDAPSQRIGYLGHRAQGDDYADIEIEILMALAEASHVENARQALLMADQKRGRYLATLTGTQPLTLSLSDLRRELDGQTVLLEYWLGGYNSYLWVLTSHTFSFYRLPGRTRIEEECRQLLNLLNARNVSISNENATTRQERIRNADAEYSVVATSLAKKLLSPAATEMGKKRVLIVSDGAIQYLPFATLPDPSRSDGALLIENHEIVNLPSLSAFRTLRRRHAKDEVPSKLLALIADPVFDVRDPRFGKADSPNVPLESGLVRAAAAARLDIGAGVPRLPFARQEARTILGLVPGGQATRFMDFDASREAVLDGRLRSFRIVHIVTHAFANLEDGDLSGLVLSLVDRRGHPIKGFLHAGEVYQLDLAADLVVLSACQTALGKDIRGEGVIGLTSAFLHAGAARVVSSAWQVDDEATAELMREFYRAMLGKHPQTPAAALREAQLAIARHDRWRSPYYWAGFLMNGDWR